MIKKIMILCVVWMMVNVAASYGMDDDESNRKWKGKGKLQEDYQEDYGEGSSSNSRDNDQNQLPARVDLNDQNDNLTIGESSSDPLPSQEGLNLNPPRTNSGFFGLLDYYLLRYLIGFMHVGDVARLGATDQNLYYRVHLNGELRDRFLREPLYRFAENHWYWDHNARVFREPPRAIGDQPFSIPDTVTYPSVVYDEDGMYFHFPLGLDLRIQNAQNRDIDTVVYSKEIGSYFVIENAIVYNRDYAIRPPGWNIFGLPLWPQATEVEDELAGLIKDFWGDIYDKF